MKSVYWLIHRLLILPFNSHWERERERERERELEFVGFRFDILVILTLSTWNKHNYIHFISLLLQTLKQSDKSYIFFDMANVRWSQWY